MTPGTLVVALNTMRAWESDDRRGTVGEYIRVGEQALVLAGWITGNQLRLRVFRNNRTLLFSSASHAAHKNWKVAVPSTQHQASRE